MIETDEFTFAESREEAMWIEAKQRYEKNLEAMKKDMVFVKAVIELCRSKIKSDKEKK